MADDGGIGRLRRRFAEMRTNIEEATQPALVKQANTMADTMRQLAPEDDGDLIDSIEVTEGGKSTPAYSQPGGQMVVPANAVAVTVGNHAVRYPHLQEHGTTKHPAQPFFWPAVRLHDKKSRQAIKRAIGAAVRKNWGKP
ncbi:HK97-gp10 family putative phage morphogenesis protein [Devosia sp.]|uniref:HK97-gp10 family putative phage morphogenesis protein n=1 Tax=Devosia sp. TaxID=1871048 RepID=UPI001AC82E0E|nr:HK97-gp10 family putative phage morphogenesis protein [Devosia sp.]MBN9333625.1 HK97 gp10 family phage protein [Devosia sp.]